MKFDQGKHRDEYFLIWSMYDIEIEANGVKILRKLQNGQVEAILKYT